MEAATRRLGIKRSSIEERRAERPGWEVRPLRILGRGGVEERSRRSGPDGLAAAGRRVGGPRRRRRGPQRLGPFARPVRSLVRDSEPRSVEPGRRSGSPRPCDRPNSERGGSWARSRHKPLQVSDLPLRSFRLDPCPGFCGPVGFVRAGACGPADGGLRAALCRPGAGARRASRTLRLVAGPSALPPRRRA